MNIALFLIATAALAAETVAPGTVQQAAKIEITTWLAGGTILAALGGLFWWFMLNKFPDMVVNAIMIRVDRTLEGKMPNGDPVTDEDDRQLLMRVGMAVVCWAEKKMPDSGLGEEKMQMVLTKMYYWTERFPFIGSKIVLRLKENEPKIKTVISKIVEKMNARLKAAEGPQKPHEA